MQFHSLTFILQKNFNLISLQFYSSWWKY